MRLALWAAIWLLLLAASAAYLWRSLRRLYRASTRLAAEVGEAERQLNGIQQQARSRQAAEPAEPEVPLAVFMPVAQAARERRAVREALSQQRRARRAANRPGWARRVDSDLT